MKELNFSKNFDKLNRPLGSAITTIRGKGYPKKHKLKPHDEVSIRLNGKKVRKAINPPGQAWQDWTIVQEIANRMGYEMNYGSASDIFDEIASVTPSMAGISHERIKTRGIQWPCPDKDHPGTEYLHKDGFPVGKAAFTSIEYRASAELPDDESPYLLTTGRNLFQYHTGSMTRRVKQIEEHAGEAYMEINPSDASKLGISHKQTVNVSSRRGSIKIKARVSGVVDEGTVFIPMHYGEALANALTNDSALDEKAKIPELKVCAVKVGK